MIWKLIEQGLEFSWLFSFWVLFGFCACGVERNSSPNLKEEGQNVWFGWTRDDFHPRVDICVGMDSRRLNQGR
jgi:hypothetical protein